MLCVMNQHGHSILIVGSGKYGRYDLLSVEAEKEMVQAGNRLPLSDA